LSQRLFAIDTAEDKRFFGLQVKGFQSVHMNDPGNIVFARRLHSPAIGVPGDEPVYKPFAGDPTIPPCISPLSPNLHGQEVPGSPGDRRHDPIDASQNCGGGVRAKVGPVEEALEELVLK